MAHADVRAFGNHTRVTLVTVIHNYILHHLSRGVSEIVLGEQMWNLTAVNRYAHPIKVAKRRDANLMGEDV